MPLNGITVDRTFFRIDQCEIYWAPSKQRHLIKCYAVELDPFGYVCLQKERSAEGSRVILYRLRIESKRTVYLERRKTIVRAVWLIRGLISTVVTDSPEDFV